jgi:hypothetical protein
VHWRVTESISVAVIFVTFRSGSMVISTVTL